LKEGKKRGDRGGRKQAELTTSGRGAWGAIIPGKESREERRVAERGEHIQGQLLIEEKGECGVL